MSNDSDPNRWARFRFAIIGPLLAAPPEKGDLCKALHELSARQWQHPVNGTSLQLSTATVERWYYAARNAQNPIKVLRRQRRNDAGQVRRFTAALIQALQVQYRLYSSWSVQLHYDNLVAQAETDDALSPLPSYSTVRRYMKNQGLHRRQRAKRKTHGAEQAQKRLENREVRSYEVDHVLGLWHLDFHHGSRKVLIASGQWVTPMLLGVIDDHSRLACHLQWYLDETTASLVHGFSQALQKRGLPRSLMTDNGSAMTSDEFCSGLSALSITHETTLPYSPYQNAKQEVFWANVEGRLMAMLDRVTDLTLEQLNDVTQAWVEQEYHQEKHAEIATSPMRRYLDSPNVGRECPNTQRLRSAFCCTVTRRQRRSDGTISLAGKRVEIPDRYRHMEQLHVRYARWDLRFVELIDPHTLATLCLLYPLDKRANADGLRRRKTPTQAPAIPASTAQDELPPLLRKLLAEHAATGRPPAYLPQQPRHSEDSS